MSSTRSYLCTILVVLGLLLPGAGAYGQHIFLDPDTVFITSGAGTTFDLDLRVDESTQGIRLFQVLIAFDDTHLDTVSTSLGALFENTPYTNVFNAYIYYDSTFEETVLRLEGLLFGSTAIVDGPGIVAEVTLTTLATGAVEMEILEHVMTDINNDPITSTAAGAAILIDVPPLDFGLISPGLGEELTAFADSSFHFVWEATTSPYAGETIEYTLEISSRSDFLSDSTVSYVTSDTTYDVPGASFVLNKSYWYRVTATGTTYGFERESTPFGRSFFVKEPFRPPGFFLLSPESGDTAYGIPGGTFSFTWGASAAPYPVEDLLYKFEYSYDPGFAPAQTVTVDGLTTEIITVNVDDLTEGVIYWRVLAYGSLFGTERESTPYPDSFRFLVGSDPGEFDLSAPVDGSHTDLYDREFIVFDWSDASSVLPNDTTTYIVSIWDDAGMSPGGEMYMDSVADVSEMDVPTSALPKPGDIWWKVLARNRYGFEREGSSSFTTLTYLRGDANASSAINVSDLTYMVDYLFRGGPEPYPIEAGDPNCSGGVNVSDLTFMVDYLFRGGSGPYCP